MAFRGVVCVGLDKCGTSWLHRCLVDQGFNDFGIKENGRSLLPDESDWDSPLIDINHNYFKENESLQKLEARDDLLVVLMLRDPLQRAEAHVAEFIKRGDRVEKVFSKSNCEELILHSKYEEILENLVNRVGSRLEVIFFEDLKERPQVIIENLCNACGMEFEFDEKILETVNSRVEPRVRCVAAFAKGVGRLLRAVGLVNVLDRARNSKLVRTLIYKPGKPAIKVEFPNVVLSKVTHEQRFYERKKKEAMLRRRATAPSANNIVRAGE